MKFSELLKYNKGVLLPQNFKAKKKLEMFKVSFYYLEPERIKLLKFSKKIKDKMEVLLDPIEICQLGMLVKNTMKIKGDIAEVGVYKGGSARIICEFKNRKCLHLIDTFEGLPETDNNDKNSVINKKYKKGQYISSSAYVKEVMAPFKNVKIYKGNFPIDNHKLDGRSFSLVHLDLDLFRSTFDCLVYFYSKMSKGGVIITHDYQSASGVKKAFDLFFKDKPEIIIELAVTQAMVVIL